MRILLPLLITIGLGMACTNPNTIAPGVAAPEFRLNTFDNSRFFLNDYLDKTVIITFWAPWCDICKEELLHLEELYREYKNAGLHIVGINIEENDTDGARRIADDYGITYTLANDEGLIVKKLFNVRSVPFTAIIGRGGKISYIQYGFGETTIKTMKEKLEVLLNETP